MSLIISFITLLLILIVTYAKQKTWRYWEKRGFQTLQSNDFLGFTSKLVLGQQSLARLMQDAHIQLKKRNIPIGGMFLFNKPYLLVADNTIMKNMIQADFDYFASRGFDFGDKSDPLQDHIFTLYGKSWSQVRRKISPMFTSGKIKTTFLNVEEHVNNLCEVLLKKCQNGQQDFLFYTYLERAGMDIIGGIAFGINCNCIKEEFSECFEMCRKVFNPSFKSIFKLMLRQGLPSFKFLIKLNTSEPGVCDYFTDMLKNTIEYRVKNNIKAKDLLQALIDLIDEQGESLTMTEMIAQSFLFFIAGFETSARTVGFIMYSLAVNEEVQEKLREKIRNNLERENGQYNYNMIMENEYLDMVVKESLRLYPPFVVINRQCTKEYKIPDTDLVVPEGTDVVFSSLGFHYDPEYFDDPFKFNPENFSKENSYKMKPCTYFPFGEGPKFCIGKRLGEMVVKLLTAKLVMNFEISLSLNYPAPTNFSSITKTSLLVFDKPVYFNLRPLQN